MGVPKFYRWLSERYPCINQIISDLTLLPEFDHFYLDMNGIIHACTHPNDQDVSQTLSQVDMMKNIWNYIDRMVTQIVKPKKLLYMAVDGVAPRAKMNQQRARRFRAAKDSQEQQAEAERKGILIDKDALFDSNCITPGTDFMALVDAHIRYFIRKKLKEDPLWRDLTVIYSGHNVPGEGEHKIMQFIRDLKADPNYQPNFRHCMYGQDADLIMLALATHEPHFTLLREVIDFGKNAKSSKGSSAMRTVIKQTKDASFQLLHISILREYLEYEFLRDVPEEKRDVERIVDDFVFLTFLVGNDFLPHLPSLDISENAFDRLFELYGNHYKTWGGNGYLTYRGEIADAGRLQAFFDEIGAMEDDIFSEREEDVAEYNKRRRKNDKRFGNTPSVPSEEQLQEEEARAQTAYQEALQKARAEGKIKTPATPATTPGQKDFRGRYYFEKLEVLDPSDSPVVRDLCRRYVEGLAWCLAYYIKGCVSWKWFYPYHYGPLISDVKELRSILPNLTFEIANPFHPFEQLLSCLPAASSKFLPRCYQFLMTSPTSPIIDFYPADFKVDMNGKHNPWEGVVLIPFIDEQRLGDAIVKYCPDKSLTKEEKSRNSFGQVLVYRYDTSVIDTVPSCNPGIFPPIPQCRTSVAGHGFSIESFTRFEPRLVPGTNIPSPGFPSLKVLPIDRVEIKPIKINVNGTESRYKTICLALPLPTIMPIDILAPELLGRQVYVNWPMMHEAWISAVSDGEFEYRVSLSEAQQDSPPHPVGGEHTSYIVNELTDEEQNEWEALVATQQRNYLYGRGVPGSGGVDVGPIVVVLKVRPLQGMQRDSTTGATKKVFGQMEAEVPIQMAMWTVPVADPRFIEQGPVALKDRMPLSSEVVFIEGPYKGQVGTIIGYSADEMSGIKVQTTVTEPERPIGLLMRQQFRLRFYESSEVVRALKLDGRIMGKITGSLMVDPGKHDLGLNLKVKNKYILTDYVRRKALDDGEVAWSSALDSVKIVGSSEQNGEADEPGVTPWEYSDKAVLLIKAYMETFPLLFEALKSRPNEVFYEASTLFGASHAEQLEQIRQWLAQQETSQLPRVPLTTTVLPREAIRAIERASDEMQTQRKRFGNRIQIRTVEVRPDEVFCCGSHRPSDAPVKTTTKPELGDRVVNLFSKGVPFGLRGTVVACHKHSACVEILFDEEFIGGTSLQGSCSNFRGKLVPWYTVLKHTAQLPLPTQPDRDKRSLSAVLQQRAQQGAAKKGQGQVVAAQGAEATKRRASADKVNGGGRPAPPPEVKVVDGGNGQPRPVSILIRHAGATTGKGLGPPPPQPKVAAPSPSSSRRASDGGAAVFAPKSSSVDAGKMLLAAISNPTPPKTHPSSGSGGTAAKTEAKVKAVAASPVPAKPPTATVVESATAAPKTVEMAESVILTASNVNDAKGVKVPTAGGTATMLKFRYAKGPEENSIGFKFARSVESSKPKPSPPVVPVEQEATVKPAVNQEMQRVLQMMAPKKSDGVPGPSNATNTTTTKEATLVLTQEVKIDGPPLNTGDSLPSPPKDKGADLVMNASALLRTVLKVEVREKTEAAESDKKVEPAESSPPPPPPPNVMGSPPTLPHNPFQPFMMPSQPQGPHPPPPPPHMMYPPMPMYGMPPPGPYPYMAPPPPPGQYPPGVPYGMPPPMANFYHQQPPPPQRRSSRRSSGDDKAGAKGGGGGGGGKATGGDNKSGTPSIISSLMMPSQVLKSAKNTTTATTTTATTSTTTTTSS